MTTKRNPEQQYQDQIEKQFDSLLKAAIKEDKKKFYANYDKPYKNFHKTIERLEKQMSWKSIFYAFISYQVHAHPNDGYNFKNKRALSITD